MEKHTKTDWIVIRNHPGKIDDIRGDSFTRLDSDERESNIELILSSPTMYHELSEIKHYAETALKSLDNQSLSEVRGMLEGILEKSKNIIK